MTSFVFVLTVSCFLSPPQGDANATDSADRHVATGVDGEAESRPVVKDRCSIEMLDPPEAGFFAKQLVYKGLPIKAPAVVVDEALQAAYDRLAMMLGSRPDVTRRLVDADVELHIIGRKQVTTDLPEWRHDKGRPLKEYNGLTRDERTRGMGGRLVSCGEENLLGLPVDRYRGRDICVHEFAHAIRTFGMTRSQRAPFDEQYRRSLARGHWRGSYSGSNPDEFFAELSMWYFGTHGDRHMDGEKPADGPEGLKAYDPEAFSLLDAFYRGESNGDAFDAATSNEKSK